MQEKIVCKWWAENLKVGVTEEKKVYTINQNKQPVELIKQLHMGAIHYRTPGSSKRISQKKINSSVKVKNYVIQEYCPF